MGTTSGRTKMMRGERPSTFRFRATSSTPQEVVRGVQGERNVVSFRFVNTTQSGQFLPMVWVVPVDQAADVTTQFYPTGMVVEPGKAFMEPGTQDSPLFSLGYGDRLFMAAISGEGNIFYTVSEDS